MRALIIMYDGKEIPESVIDQLMLAIQDGRTQAHVISLSEGEVAQALIIQAEKPAIIDNTDQESINHAAAYIAAKVLSVSTNPVYVTYLISRYITEGDVNMRTAVEILATKSGAIREPKFTKSILTAIKAIYKEGLA